MGRLKGIPDVLSPDILHLLAVTGHGDEIILADINLPSHSLCQGPDRPKEYRADGIQIPTLLNSILKLMPLDWYHPWQMAVMDMTDRDKKRLNMKESPVVEEYKTIGNLHEGSVQSADKTVFIEKIERFKFYEHAKTAYAIVHTGDTTPYGSVILKRGVC